MNENEKIEGRVMDMTDDDLKKIGQSQLNAADSIAQFLKQTGNTSGYVLIGESIIDGKKCQMHLRVTTEESIFQDKGKITAESYSSVQRFNADNIKPVGDA